MPSVLSRMLTGTTVLMLGVILLTTVVNSMIETDLAGWIIPLMWVLGALVLLRLIFGLRSFRSGAAAPVMDSASMQSGFYGFTPGSSTIEHTTGPAYTTTEIDEDPRNRAGNDPL